ncbi:phosphoenolpyruvate--protein phosphotransferase [Anaerocolumna xylanovorans]|uniref:Phosphoenolpyruvate-protein phosphotransferase n=1 Tax=Anaerocolumna xylanovorans DSM 12503 TaxID=1121345 RepID=A0A1M7Y0Q4_9FIRM|nr:phosphoenolpyruvate--protein phosphotransferase [Anaerocolumna xylanovorans]SHO45260.1 phosphotransferase system, enzyme I, PtsI [Anaerocolumna xylanovorans DSM 12503]
MQKISGKSVQNGTAIGKIKVYTKIGTPVKRIHVNNAVAEILRVEKAVNQAIMDLQNLYKIAVNGAGEDSAAIFEVHQMMLEDEDYNDSIRNIIEHENVNAEFAVARTNEIFSDIFASMEDEYMKARAIDIKDISNRLIHILTGEEENILSDLKEKVILIADDLTPSETVQLEKSMILAFVTVHGSLTSHTAILARTMNIPALISVPIENINELDGKIGIIDGKEAVLYIEPDDNTIEFYEKAVLEEEVQKKLLLELRGKPTVTSDGKEIHLCANVGNIGDIAFAQSNDADGIGLFRSEFIYLGSKDYPTEEEQFQMYKQALQLMEKKKVIIRTCDIGADKQVDYFCMDKEENPALGYRAIRICLDRVDFFKTQLRALFRAAVFGSLSIMYPMIISLDEVKRIKEIVSEVQTELETSGIPYAKHVEQGIMIETPAAALISDELAREVDFFSVGTNDLTQYTLAIDRQNGKLDSLYDKHHRAILSLIKMAADNAHANGKWIGICGELGSDLELTKTFLDMGIDELSVSPGMILKVRKRIMEL